MQSMDYLKDRVANILEKEFDISNPWFIDYPDWYQYKLPESKDEVVDIVIFGAYLQRFFETGNLISENCRFWVISEQVKKVYTELLDFPNESITVIPRSKISPSCKEKELPRENFDLVYSGRISPVKNIEFYLHFAHALQCEHSIECRPVLFGDFDNIQHDQHGRLVSKDYQKHIKDLIKTLDWKNDPLFLGLYPREEWLIHKQLNNPIFCSFTTYSKEDYGVSFAQAEMEGWPSIVSAWGGHLDSEQNNILKVPFNRIGQSHEEKSIIKGKARALAREFIENKEQFKLPSFKTDFTLPSPLSLSQLDQIRRKAIQKWGIDTFFLTRQLSDHYADTSNGIRFFNEFQNTFGAKDNTEKHVLVLHDFNLELYGKAEEVHTKLEELAYKLSSSKKHIEVVVSRDLATKPAIEKLIKSTQVYVFGNETNSKKIKDTIEKIIGPEKIVEI